ncbi:peroxidasin homolog isoform X2 [Acanthaster planci]|uniref:Peroxidasin homolog isoform X1 n=1 Tax=Acanthaster planci TaxID=133434 RepID=A0A8B7XXA7_ACAPL|nr:peroxidasin homolog isoform X1 [Acanthaster planci]XP_022084892.1 peroxidasin homolog isoform X2 [Acanthaster planci]XP_022084893.1 peroxidasin homolog isoform X2 [Acanthaster planci]
MYRLLLLALLVSLGSCTLLDKDVGMLEDLEDLLLKDENMKGYSNQKNGRTPFGLWNQFNSARRSPMNRKKLQAYLKMLEERERTFTRVLSTEDIESRIAEIKHTLETRQTCATTTPQYRTIDGSCNNIAKPEQGAAETLLIRVVDNAYDDGLSKPRTKSVAGGPLPNARNASRAVFDNRETTLSDLTTLAMHFGQLTDHDLTAVHTPSDVNCSDCSVDGECFSILINNADPVFGGVQACFPFVRSNFETDSSGVRQHINSITGYLDASFVYGSDDASALDLIDSNGFLLHDTDGVTGRQLLPPDVDLDLCAGVNETEGIYCGKAGDGRAPEQPGLTALHTLFLREHNRVADALLSLDSTLSPFNVYQTARKIVGAEWQHIVYNEFLPLIVGADLYASEGLSPDSTYAYNPAVDASSANVFAAAAFRFGHTLVPFDITRVNRNYRPRFDEIKLTEAFFNATYIYDESIPDGAVDSILRGMTVQNSQKVDRHFSDAITDNLFGDPDKEGDGFDLTALNIQRARDHGLPGYTTIRKDFCELGEINSFRDLFDDGVMTRQNFRNLRDTYADVRDIDAFVGFVLEKPLPNALVGPTLACIFADQFRRLKFGDRFFYQSLGQFTPAQIQEIEKASMARLLCDNVEAVDEIQPYIFMKARNFGNLERRQQGKRGPYTSFYEYSRSGAWPHKRETVLEGLDNRRVSCTATSGEIPVVDLSKFV